MNELIELIKPASKGEIMSKNSCFDAGNHSLFCINIVEPNKPNILLLQWGDDASKNTSESAQKLTKILLKEMLY